MGSKKASPKEMCIRDRLYGVPDGMGIQFDEAAYLTDPNHEIYSRYVMTAADTPTAARLDAEGWQVIYQSEKCMIYMRTM